VSVLGKLLQLGITIVSEAKSLLQMGAPERYFSRVSSSLSFWR